MSEYRLSKVEQEVIINFNASEGTASVYAADPVWIRKMDKLVTANPDEFKMVEQQDLKGELVSRVYEFPKSLITIRSKTVKRELTDEQREAMALVAKERFRGK